MQGENTNKKKLILLKTTSTWVRLSWSGLVLSKINFFICVFPLHFHFQHIKKLLKKHPPKKTNIRKRRKSKQLSFFFWFGYFHCPIIKYLRCFMLLYTLQYKNSKHVNTESQLHIVFIFLRDHQKDLSFLWSINCKQQLDKFRVS